MASMGKNCSYEYKICLLGDFCVGKSSIIQRFVHNTYNPNIESTIGASFSSKTLFIKNICYKLHVWDTAGQERFRALAPMYYRNANICIIVYDIACKESFDSIQTWIHELQKYKLKKNLICIVGNKSDLEDKRQVLKSEAKLYAKSVDAYFIETSAKEFHNITELFINALTLYKELEDKSDDFVMVNDEAIQLNLDRMKEKSKCC